MHLIHHDDEEHAALCTLNKYEKELDKNDGCENR